MNKENLKVFLNFPLTFPHLEFVYMRYKSVEVSLGVSYARRFLNFLLEKTRKKGNNYNHCRWGRMANKNTAHKTTSEKFNEWKICCMSFRFFIFE